MKKSILKKIWDMLPKSRPCWVPGAEAWIGEKRNRELNDEKQRDPKGKAEKK